MTCGRGSLVSFDEACRLLSIAATGREAESVALDQAGGRVLAQDIVARRDAPGRAVSAMDGYAVCERALDDLPACLPVIGTSFAGRPFAGPLPPNTCVRIFTGAALPEGADRVIMQEDVREIDGRAHFTMPCPPRRHVRAAASDFAKGDILLNRDVLITPQRLVSIAAADMASVEVYRRPRVAILCCGDELVEPGHSIPHPDHVPESISHGLAALVQDWGGIVIARWRRGDQLDALRLAARDAVAAADIVVVVGGASVGEKDLAKDAFAVPGFEMLFTRVAIKPGMPVWFGRQERTFILGLPGNPTSAIVTARLFLAPLLAELAGHGMAEAWTWQTLRLGASLDPSGERDSFLRATIMEDIVTPLSNQDSASQSVLARATHLIRHRTGASFLAAGSTVQTLAL